MTLSVDDAGDLLGCPSSEVESVEDSPAGDIVSTTDGCRMIVVPEDHPDGEGKTGLMFLVAPSETYGGAFPVFAQPPEDEPVVPDASAPDMDGDHYGDLDKAGLVALLTERGVAFDRRLSPAKLVALIVADDEQRAAQALPAPEPAERVTEAPAEVPEPPVAAPVAVETPADAPQDPAPGS